MVEEIIDYAFMLLKLVVAGACGAAVGWEREAHEKAAGLRTHILMAVGACLFTILAVDIEKGYPNTDLMRIVQGTLMGTGFICGGVIFRDGNSVRGLTTAAGLWVMGAVGVAVGLGAWVVALMTTGVTFLAMTALRRGKRFIHKIEGPLSPADGDEAPGDGPLPGEGGEAPKGGQG